MQMRLVMLNAPRPGYGMLTRANLVSERHLASLTLKEGTNAVMILMLARRFERTVIFIVIVLRAAFYVLRAQNVVLISGESKCRNLAFQFVLACILWKHVFVWNLFREAGGSAVLERQAASPIRGGCVDRTSGRGIIAAANEAKDLLRLGAILAIASGHGCGDRAARAKSTRSNARLQLAFVAEQRV
jgi:hypothetical protein